jgi:hypothetical protein
VGRLQFRQVAHGAEAAKEETKITHGRLILRLGHRNDEESKR